MTRAMWALAELLAALGWAVLIASVLVVLAPIAIGVGVWLGLRRMLRFWSAPAVVDERFQYSHVADHACGRPRLHVDARCVQLTKEAQDRRLLRAKVEALRQELARRVH